MKERFHGVYAALLTPFDEKDRIDIEKLKKLVNFLLSKEINGLYICGSSGEGFLMDIAERKLIAEVVKDEVKEKVEIIAQVGSHNARNAIELAKHAEKIGLSAVSSVPPLYYRYTFSEIYNYYASLAGATSLPFFIYYIPATTGVSLSSKELSKFKKIKTIVGLKYTESNFYLLQDLLQKLEGEWIAFCGSDQQFLPALTMGVVGSIGTTQNILPDVFVNIYNYFHQKKNKKAMELQSKITEAVTLLLSTGWPQAWKAILELKGIDAGYCRAPFLRKLSEEEKTSLFKKWREIFPEDIIP